MAKIIDGKAISAEVKAKVAKEVAALKGQGISVGLAVVIVGDDSASRVYVNNKKKACEAVGIYSEEYALPASTSQQELHELVGRFTVFWCNLRCLKGWMRQPWWRLSRPKRMWTLSMPIMWEKLCRENTAFCPVRQQELWNCCTLPE